MKIAIKDKRNGKIYSNSMQSEEGIIEMHFCTSYTQVIVQDVSYNEEGKKLFPTHDVILPPLDSEPSWIDLIATQDDAEGEWINE